MEGEERGDRPSLDLRVRRVYEPSRRAAAAIEEGYGAALPVRRGSPSACRRGAALYVPPTVTAKGA